MTQSSYPFDTSIVTEAQFSAMFRHFQDNGVIDGGLAVTANSSGMTVSVAQGNAFVRGIYYANTAPVSLTIAASGSTPRIDSVILRLDPAQNSTVLAVKQGVATVTPSPPALTQTDAAIYEERLADVLVAANAVTIASADVTNHRKGIGFRSREWTTATRPASPRIGMVGFNTSLNAPEFWNGTAWVSSANFSSSLPGRTMHVGTGAPAASLGVNGDIYIEY